MPWPAIIHRAFRIITTSKIRMRISKFLIFLLLAVAIFNSCRKEEEFTTDGGVSLTFSADTLFFDTVFTQHGTSYVPLSVTKQLRVTNTNEKAVRVNIRLQGN